MCQQLFESEEEERIQKTMYQMVVQCVCKVPFKMNDYGGSEVRKE